MPEMQESRGSIMRRLAQAWRRRRRFLGARGAGWLLLWAVALAAVDFLVDWRADLPGRWRVALLGASLLTLAAVAYASWWRKLRPYDPARVALEVERLYPQLHSLLVSYVQFQDGEAARSAASPALVGAMLSQAEERAAALPFGKVVRFRSLWRLWLYALGAALAAAAAVGLQPGFARVFAGRMLNPNSALRYPTRTIFEETSGNMVVQYGHPAVLRVLVSGELPEDALIRFEPEGEQADTLRVLPAEARTDGRREFRYCVEDLYRSFAYSFRAGDAASPPYRVQVVAAPHTEVAVTVTYPEYTGQKQRGLQMLSFEAPAGSRVDWKITSDRALAEARMLLESGATVPVALADAGRAGSVVLTPTNSFSYGFQWTDRDHHFVFAPEVRYSVRVVPDRPPLVALRSPVLEEKATVHKTVELAFTAKDDYGLASARLVYSIHHGPADPQGEPEKRQELVTFPEGSLEAAESSQWRVLEAIPGLKPGDTVHYAVEVLDKQPAPAGPGVARSETCQLTIVSQEEYVQLAMERRRRLLARIKSLHGEERDASDTVQGLLKEPEQKPAPPGEPQAK